MEESLNSEDILVFDIPYDNNRNQSYKFSQKHKSVKTDEDLKMGFRSKKFVYGNEPRIRAQINREGGDDLFTVLKVPLIIGASFGLIPIRGLRANSFQTGQQAFKWCQFRTLISITVASFITLHTFFITHSFLLKIWSKKNSAGDLVIGFSGVWFYWVGTLVYGFFLFRSQSLCNYFQLWLKVSERISGTLSPDPKLRRDVNLICIVVFLDCLGENMLYHFHAMDPEKRGRMGSLSFGEVLRDYFDSNQYIFPFFEYNSVVALALLFTNKLTTYAWNFGDVFLMVFFRALYSRFKSLNRFLESLMIPDGSLSLVRKGSISWATVRQTFLLLNKLLEEGNKHLAPLIWLSYVTDIFFVCRQLYEGLAPNGSVRWGINKVYVAWSLLHLILRTIGVNLMAALISENAHRISKLLQHCHPDEYDDNVRRLEQYLGSKIIGITGNGCFIITRSFILMVMSAIFTLEVVLLQNASITVG